MAPFSAIFGLDDRTVNEFIKRAHEVARKEVFVGTVDASKLGLPGLASVGYDFVDPPRVSLTPSAAFRAARLADLTSATDVDIDPSAAALLADDASRASLELCVEHVNCTINYSDGTNTKLQAAMNAAFTVAVDTGGTLTQRLGSLQFTVVGEPAMTDILNKALVPTLRDRIQTKILKPTVVPPLSVEGLTVSLPTVGTGQGRLLATTCQAPTIADAAPFGGPWPTGTMFVAVDYTLANKAINTRFLPKLQASGTGVVVKRIKFWFGSSTIKADYQVAATRVQLSAVPGAPTQLRGTADLATYVHLYAKSIGSWTGRGTTSATAVGEVASNTNNEVTVALKRLENVKLRIDFHNTPKFADQYLSTLPTVIWMQARGLFDAVLAAQQPIAVAKLPTWYYPAGGKRLWLYPTKLTVGSMAVPDGRMFLTATASPGVRIGEVPS